MAGPASDRTTNNNNNNADADTCVQGPSEAVLADAELFPLHKAVFHNDIEQLARTLKEGTNIDPNAKDTHGNTALHLAAMLGNIDAAKLLLEHGAQVRVKNNEGWKSLQEAISYGDRQLIRILLVAYKQQLHRTLSARLPDICDHLSGMQDFYLEAKWEIRSWVPLISRTMPSDTFRIYKRGSKLRVDFTLIDFNFHWREEDRRRRDMSLLYDPTAPEGCHTVLMDNQKQIYGRVTDKNWNLNNEIDLLLGTDITTCQISTQPIQFVRARNWLFGGRSDQIGEYEAEVFHIEGMRLVTRKRREHLSLEEVKQNRALQQDFFHGNGKVPDVMDGIEAGKSLSPPPKPDLSWAQYLREPDGPQIHLGREKVEKTNRHEVKGMIALSQQFPMTVDHLLDILHVLESVHPTVRKFRTFCSSGRLPPGFPVQLEIPVFATLSMKVSFQQFRWRDADEDNEDSFRAAKFQVPEHFREDPKNFPSL